VLTIRKGAFCLTFVSLCLIIPAFSSLASRHGWVQGQTGFYRI